MTLLCRQMHDCGSHLIFGDHAIEFPRTHSNNCALKVPDRSATLYVPPRILAGARTGGTAWRRDAVAEAQAQG